MPTLNIPAERTQFVVRAGGIHRLQDPLNQGDAIDVSLNAAGLLGSSSETLSSASWSADSGITVSNASVSTPVASATLTAASTALGEVVVECQLTGSGNTVRTVALIVEVVNLR